MWKITRPDGKRLLAGAVLVATVILVSTPARSHPFKEKIYSADITPLYKWTDVIDRMDADQVTTASFHRVWDGPPTPAGVRMINEAVNRFRFINDMAGWGKSDYWQTPGEFLLNGGGDCEDFAITKYAWLKAAGVREQDMRIAVVKDRFLKTMHTLLLVDVNGERLVLDNQEMKTGGYIMQKRYEPLFSFNREAWWLY